MNLALLKKKSNTQKISQDFSQQLSWQIFTNFHLSSLLTSLFYLPLLNTEYTIVQFELIHTYIYICMYVCMYN